MERLKELQEKRNKLAADIRAMADRFNAQNKAWKDDAERSAWEKLNADYDANFKELNELRTKIEAEQAIAARAAEVAKHDERSRNHGSTIPGLEDTGRGDAGTRGRGDGEITEEVRGLALAGWLLGNRRSQRHAEAMQRVGLHDGELVIPLANTHNFRALQRQFRSVHPSRALDHCLESRALSAVDGTSGGVTIGTTLLRQLEINMLAFGGMRQVSDVITTATGDEMRWPTADDTSNTGEQLGESTSVGSSVDPSFGAVVWNAYKYSSKPILVPYELLQDSFVDLPSVLGAMLGERLGRITNTRFTTGTGASQPKGIITAASSGVTAASATAIAADEIIGLVHSIDPAYRSMASGFMCHDSILLHIRKLKDGNGQYLMGFGLTQNLPDTILGYPVVNNQDMASSVATGNKTLLFGKLNAYKIRRVGSVRLYRLEERYRDTDQTAFLAFMREDGNLLDAGTDPVKFLTQA